MGMLYLLVLLVSAIHITKFYPPTLTLISVFQRFTSQDHIGSTNGGTVSRAHARVASGAKHRVAAFGVASHVTAIDQLHLKQQ